MTRHHATVKRTAMRYALGGAGARPWAGSRAIAGSHADSGIGLVVVDQGNPRRARGIAH